MQTIMTPIKEAFAFAPKTQPQWTNGQQTTGTSSLRSFSDVPRRSLSLLRRASVQKPIDVPEALMKYEIPSAINEKQHVEHQMEKLCLKKAELTFARLCFLGLLSGVWMVLSACCAMTVAAGISKEIIAEFPKLPNLMLAFFGPVAMHFIVVFGGEFFSGNCMYFCVGIFKGRVTVQQMAFNLWWVFIWNALGCILACYVCGYLTGIFEAPDQRAFVIAAAEGKAKLSFMTSFLRGIPANILICTSIQMGISARDMAGKILVLHMPLTVYTVAGFEHSITNLVVVPMGVMYGADVNVASWIWNNLIPSAIGNFVGGGIIIGGFVTLLYSWDESGHGNLNMPTPIRRQSIYAGNTAWGGFGTGLAKVRGNLIRALASPETREELDKRMNELKDAQEELYAAKARLEETKKQDVNVKVAMAAVMAYERESSLRNMDSPFPSARGGLTRRFPDREDAGSTEGSSRAIC
mmetsp:Transcript_42126/g.103234  ORF Transcript_42126/g.103234 Transcript_42126/m.103234 type:complete len:465 (-) Transcript_42126:160-1554(-)